MWPWKKRKAELIPVPTHGPVKLEPAPVYSLVAYVPLYARRQERVMPYVCRYESLKDELWHRFRMSATGLGVAYRVTVKPKAA